MVLKKGDDSTATSGYCRDIVETRSPDSFRERMNRRFRDSFRKKIERELGGNALTAQERSLVEKLIAKNWMQHDDQVAYLTKDFLQLPAKKFERFLVTEEDGTTRVVCGESNLKLYLQKKKISYPVSDSDGPEKSLSKVAFFQNKIAELARRRLAQFRQSVPWCP